MHQRCVCQVIEYLVTTGNESDLRVASNRLDLTGFSLIG